MWNQRVEGTKSFSAPGKTKNHFGIAQQRFTFHEFACGIPEPGQTRRSKGSLQAPRGPAIDRLCGTRAGCAAAMRKRMYALIRR